MKDLTRRVCILMIAAMLTVSQAAAAIPAFANETAANSGSDFGAAEDEGADPEAGTESGSGKAEPSSVPENRSGTEDETGTESETGMTDNNVTGDGSGKEDADADTAQDAAPELQELSLKTAASVVRIRDDDKVNLDTPGTQYELFGSGERVKDGNFFTVPDNRSNEGSPIIIVLDNVNRTQSGKSPDNAFINIKPGNYVIIKLRGNNYIESGQNGTSGKAGIHVSAGSTVKVTSEEGDGSTAGTLDIYGGGKKYGAAGIGSNYTDDGQAGSIIIAGGTIRAHGAHCAAGIGSGRDTKCTSVQITGGNVYAEGGEYAAGIGAGDNVGTSSGGNLIDISITGGSVTAVGGGHAAGIGCSEGGHLEGNITIENAEVNATGGTQGAGIGGGDGADFYDNSRISIRSGNITAAGGSDGAGIGGGNHTHNVRVSIDQDEGKDLTINASGGKNAAGIGAGDEDGDYVRITLHGGNITAAGGENGAGIGAGDNVNEIVIKGSGTITAHGGKTAAGIGGGNDSTVKNKLLIEGDTTGGSVVRGEAPEGSRGLEINAVASYGVEPESGYDNEGAAIGGGKSKCCDITVRNAVLHTRADEQGADIGGGGFHAVPDASGVVDTITIENCEITSTSIRKVSPGIGAGYGGSVNHIVIKDTRYTGGGIGGAIMDRNYRGLNSVDSIRIDNSDITAKWDEVHPGHCQSEIVANTTPLDHGAAGIGSGQFGSIDEITITNCRIDTCGYGSGAGIGGGGAGGKNWSVLSLEKYDIGDVGTISISDSHVDAESGCAKFTDKVPTTIDDGYKTYEIDAIDFGGGAGIGSGSASGVEKIDIHDCDYVKAKGHSGSGIGGGCGTGFFMSGWVDHIWLENIDKLDVEGGRFCAGIGTGGGDGIRTSSSCVLKEIYIKNCGKNAKGNFKVSGGYGAAGIGLGYTSRYKEGFTDKGSKVITIVDSNLEAEAGKLGAGIGGSCEETITGYGGDSPTIRIEGQCQIKAAGGAGELYEHKDGSYGGGAGIGGGSRGGASNIEIALPSNSHTAATEVNDPSENGAYIIAIGGSYGGAGIGSGGTDWVNGQITKGNADSETIMISGGAIYAYGGSSSKAGDDQWGGDFYTGAGAGIGGGSGRSSVDKVTISGGYIEAKAGSCHNDSDRADDIGCGGDWSSKSSPQDRKCGTLKISDGTVVAEKFGSFSNGETVDGGSIKGIISNARTSDGTRVYRTTATLKDEAKTQVNLSISQSYGQKCVYTDKDRKLYLYLFKKGSLSDKTQTADITVNTGKTADKRHYYGYTDTEHTGLLKMKGTIVHGHADKVPFKDQSFSVFIDDKDYAKGTKWHDFKAEGDAEIVSVKKDESPGVELEMKALKGGEYTVTAQCESAPGSDAEIYWNSEFEYTGIVKKDAYVDISGDLTKVFDGNQVQHPKVSTNSDDKYPDYHWFYTDGTPTPNYNPHFAGDYYVYVSVDETDRYGPAESEKLYFSILKAPTSVTQNVKMSDGKAVITADVSGLISPVGYVQFTIKKKNESGTWDTVRTENVPAARKDDKIQAVLETGMVSGGDYEVSVQYLECENYQASNVDTRSYHKGSDPPFSFDIEGKTEYTVSVRDKEHPVVLDLHVVPSGTDVTWTSEIVSDTADIYHFEKTAEINNDDPLRVNIKHAGTVTVKVTAAEKSGKLEPVSKLVTVTVTKGKLYAKPFMYSGGTVQNSGDCISSVIYGSNTASYNSTVLFTDGDDSSDTTYYSIDHYGGPGEHIGTLDSERPDMQKASAGKTFTFDVIKNGKDVTFDGKTYRNVFLWRDYDIECRQGSISVTKASIVLSAQSEVVRYGDPEPEYTWYIDDNAGRKLYADGLASWDEPEDVFDENGAQVGIDTVMTGGKGYEELGVGLYNNPLTINGSLSPNYEAIRPKWPYDNRREPGTERANLKITAADISDADRFDINVTGGNVYGEESSETTIEVIDNSCFGKKITLQKDTDYSLAWADDSKQEIVVTGKGNYTGSVKVKAGTRPRTITVSTESASKVYDGEPLKAGGSITGVLDSDKDKLEFKVTGSQTEAGKSRNTYSLTFIDPDLAKCYKVSEEKIGTLTVVSNDIGKCSVSQPEDVVYNGNEQKQSVTVTDGLHNELVRDVDYELSYSDRTKTGTTDTIKNAGKVTVTVTGIGKYCGTAVVTYDIRPATLSIVTKSASKAYDGEPLTAGGEATGFIEGETATFRTTGEITNAGSVPNTYELIWNGTADSSNYVKGRVEIGELRVEPADGQNAVYAEGYQGIYDGNEHTVTAEALVEGSVITYSTDGGKSWSNDAPSFKDATADPVSVRVRAAANDPNHNYDDAEVAVQVVIEKAPLIVKTGSDSKVYDGSPLTCSKASVTGLAGSETAAVTATGSQTEVGSSVNKYRIDWNSAGTSASENNYRIDEEDLGMLTVTEFIPDPAKIVINRDLSKVCDGEKAELSKAAAASGKTPDIYVSPDSARPALIVSYYDAAGNKLEEGPKEPGSYTVKAAVNDSDPSLPNEERYKAAYDSRDFNIEKYRTQISISAPERILYEYDLNGESVETSWTVSASNSDDPYIAYEADKGKAVCRYEKKQNDGSYSGITAAPSDEGDYRVTVTASETDHYTAAEKTAYFRIIGQQETELSVKVESKTYDGKAAEPVLSCSRGTEGVSYTYYRSDGTSLGSTAPRDAGDYEVEAVLPAARGYSGAKARASFSIRKRTVAVDTEARYITASESKLIVYVDNGLEDLNGTTVKVSITTKSGQDYEREQPLDENLKTVFDFPNALPDVYTVTPELEYSGDNYHVICSTRTYDKNKGDYSIQLKDAQVGLDFADFDLAMRVTDSRSNILINNPDYYYEIAGESTEGNYHVLNVAESGRLRVEGAGTALVRVNVRGNERYNGRSAYAEVTVDKGRVSIVLRTGRTEREYDGRPSEIRTGLSYGSDHYPVQYDSEKIEVRYYETDDSGQNSAGIDGPPKDAGRYRAAGSAPDDDNFIVEDGSADFTIVPAGISVVTGSASKEYDGSPLTCSVAKIRGLVNGETAVITATGSQTDPGSTANTYRIAWAEDDPQKATASERNYIVKGEELGTLRVTERDISYSFTEGADAKWTRGSGSKLAFKVVRSHGNASAFDHFTGVSIDNAEVGKESYTAKSGSVILTLDAEYLEKLPAGRHTIAALFDDGRAETQFTVSDAGSPGDDSGGGTSGTGGSSRTGDDQTLTLWLSAMLLSISALSALIIQRYLRRYRQK